MGNFDENSMAKARIALNDLVEKSWVELDDKIIECKEYQEMNRGTFDQVVTDISRLVEQITDLERVETESLEGIAKMEMEIKGVEAELSKETKIYNYNFAKNNPPDCGLLHVKLSLMWGDYKDKVDELTMEMNKNAFMFEELKMELNDQIQILSNSKARFSMMLSEARSNLALDREEVKAKEQQKLNVACKLLNPDTN